MSLPEWMLDFYRFDSAEMKRKLLIFTEDESPVVRELAYSRLVQYSRCKVTTEDRKVAERQIVKCVKSQM